MKIALSLVILMTTMVIVTDGKTVSLADFGANGTDNASDNEAFLAAREAIVSAGGGTLVIPEGLFDLSTELSFVPPGNNYLNVHIVGNGASVIRINGVYNGIVFGNNLNVTISKVAFIGRQVPFWTANFIDAASYVIYASSVERLSIRDCQFLGFRSSGGVIGVANADLTIEDTALDGNSAALAVVHSFSPYNRGFTIDNVSFLDYGNFNGIGYSKTPAGNPQWILVEAPQIGQVNAIGQRGVQINNARFDEGAGTAITIANYAFAEISNINVNVSGVDGGKGIDFSNVPNAFVRSSQFGYTSSARWAILARNSSKVNVEGIRLGGAVTYGARDSTSDVYFDNRFCRNCSVDVIR